MTIIGQVAGRWKPSTEVTFLPRCPGCHDPHPRALGLAQDTCVLCGTNCPTGATRIVATNISGFSPWAILARMFLAIGRFLYSLAER